MFESEERPDLTEEEETAGRPAEQEPTEAGSGELDEDALEEGEEKLRQAGGGH